MTVKIVGKTLVIEIEIQDPPAPSASGKTLIIASTHGNQATTATVQGKPVVIGLNVYIRR